MKIMIPPENHPKPSSNYAMRRLSASPWVWGILALAVVAIVVALSFLVPGIPAPAH
jgi:hypothetical protein